MEHPKPIRALLIALCAALICQIVAPAMGARAAGEITFSIGEGVSTEDEFYIREGIVLAREYVAATLTPYPGSTIVVNARNNSDTTGGHAAAFSGGDFIVVFTRSPGWRSLAPFDRVHVVAHEYVHSWQRATAGPGSDAIPLWLLEGTAEYLAYDAVVREGLVRRQEVSDVHAFSVLGAPEMSPLEQLEGRDAFYGEPGPAYSLAWLAIEMLLADGSPAEIDHFFGLVGSGVAWRDAFADAFGQDVNSFYESFAGARTDLIGPRTIPESFDHVTPVMSASPIVLVATPETVVSGEQMTVLARSEPGATCGIRLRSAESGERLTRITVTDGAGRLFWLITFPPEFGGGPAVLTANCGGAGVRDDFTVSPAT
jgi:hypothetical protein